MLGWLNVSLKSTYGNKGRAFNYQQSESYVKMPISAWCYIPTSLPQEQAAKTDMSSTKLEKPGKALQLQQCCIKRSNKSPLDEPLSVQIVKYWWWFWRQWCRDVASDTDRHLDITFGLQVVERSSLVSVLVREAFNHPYISFFHLLVNGFSVIRECCSTLYICRVGMHCSTH